MSKDAVVLYSGGLDSTVVLAQYIAKGLDVLALTIDYGQSNDFEIDVCKQLASFWGFPHKVIQVHLERTDATAEIPARNTVFLAKALEWALLTGAKTVAYGAEPDATYADSSPAYIEAMDHVMRCHGVTLQAPIRNWAGKKDVLMAALDLGVPLDLVHSSRTNQINGACTASRRYLRTLADLFPSMNPVALLKMLKDAHFYTNQNPYCISTPDTQSFKFFPALLLLSSMAAIQEETTIYTTGNWGMSFAYVNKILRCFGEVNIRPTQDVAQLAKNDYNTDAKEAVWGTKQALSRLPRPQYLKAPLHCRVTQGHLKAAIESLGYETTGEIKGFLLTTETY